ncbi:hypothetical protein [Crocinitomix catalasitica]|uniref:hypothetical protein n=1 Tax=Crocinitomix catalasitica TaxID=184607 RepID=UPI000487CFBF|nr:hypothetical protein [Crocinitomix catalasitica]
MNNKNKNESNTSSENSGSDNSNSGQSNDSSADETIRVAPRMVKENFADQTSKKDSDKKKD